MNAPLRQSPVLRPTIAALICRKHECQRTADAYAADDPAMARIWQAEADDLERVIGARMAEPIRVTDEASWLDYEQARMLAAADRRAAAPEPVVSRSLPWRLARAAWLPVYLAALGLVLWGLA